MFSILIFESVEYFKIFCIHFFQKKTFLDCPSLGLFWFLDWPNCKFGHRFQGHNASPAAKRCVQFCRAHDQQPTELQTSHNPAPKLLPSFISPINVLQHQTDRQSVNAVRIHPTESTRKALPADVLAPIHLLRRTSLIPF